MMIVERRKPSELILSQAEQTSETPSNNIRRYALCKGGLIRMKRSCRAVPSCPECDLRPQHVAHSTSDDHLDTSSQLN